MVVSPLPPREFRVREPQKNVFIMQNLAFGCILGSETAGTAVDRRGCRQTE